MRTPELKPLRIGEILDVSIRIVLAHASKLLRVAVFPALAVQVIVVAIYLTALPSNVLSSPPSAEVLWVPDDSVGQPADTDEEVFITEDEKRAWDAANVVAGLLLLLAALVSNAACFKAVSEAYLGGRPDWRESLKFALKRLHSILWIAIVQWVLIVLGLFAFVIPGIALYGLFAVSEPALLAEGHRGWKALARSAALVNKRWWATVAVIVVSLILLFIFQMLGGLLFAGLVAADFGGSSYAALIYGAVIDTISLAITLPVQAAVIAVLYFDLRVRKEGFDLQLLAERIESPALAAPAAAEPPTTPAPGTSPPGTGPRMSPPPPPPA